MYGRPIQIRFCNNYPWANHIAAVKLWICSPLCCCQLLFTVLTLSYTCQYLLFTRVKRSLSWLNWRYVTNSLFISLPDPFSRPVSLYRPSWKIRGCDLGWSLTDRIVFQIPVSIQRVKKPSVKIINSTNSLHYNNMTALMMDSALCSVLKQS